MAVKDFTQTGSDTITGQTVSDGGDFDGKNVGMSVIRIGGVSAAIPIDIGSGAIDVGTARVALATDSPGIIATVAHDAADSGDPLKVGSKSVSSLSGQTPVAANDRSNLFSDLDGVAFARPYSLADIVTGTASCTDGASTECIAAQSAGIKTYLSKVVLTNSSASAALVEIKDGTTVKATLSVPANKLSTSFTFDPPLPGTAATAWNFDPDAALSTIYCTMVGFKSKV